MRLLLFAVSLVLGCIAAAWAADYTAGLVAHDRGDYATALREWAPFARLNVPEAQHQLGVLYSQGLGVASDPATAATWFRRAAVQGYAAAQYNLGLFLLQGKGVPQDVEKAVRWLSRAARQGIPLAQYQLGLLYSQSPAIPRNYTAAARWFRRVAAQGDPLSQYQLGLLYSQGQGVRKDPLTAYVWFTLAAEQGYTKAAASRDTLATQLATTERTEAQTKVRIAQFRRQHPPEPLTARQASPPLVAEIQRALTALGHNPGSMDGRAGPRTVAAIRAYQQQAGLPVDGVASERLLRELSRTVSQQSQQPADRRGSRETASSSPRQGATAASQAGRRRERAR